MSSPLTAFEVPDLRRLVALGKYEARRLTDGRIELSPVDPSSGPRFRLQELVRDAARDEFFVPPRRHRR
jgi:hypothetical protein